MSLVKWANSTLTAVGGADSNDKSQERNDVKWRPYVVASAVGSTVVAGACFYFKYRAVPHDNVPLLAPKDISFFTGHLRRVLECSEEIDDSFQEWIYQSMKAMDFPPMACMTLPIMNYVFMNDPQIIKQVLEDNHADVIRVDRDVEIYEPLLGHGIFTSNGERWKFHRKIASRMFSMRNLKDFMYNITMESTRLTMDKLHCLSTASSEFIDINNLLGRFTLDTFARIAFGVNLKSVGAYPQTHAFGEAFDDLVFRLDQRTVNVFWKLGRALGSENERAIAKSEKIVSDFVYDILDRQKQSNFCDADSGANAKYDLLTLYQKHNSELSREDLKDIALNFIIAGRDTTRMLLSWFVYELCEAKNVAVTQKIYAEIDAACGGNQEAPSYRDFVTGFRYLEGALCETLRLWPSVPLIGRVASKDIEVRDAVNERTYVLRKGDGCVASCYAMGRNPKLWGDGVMQFRPERWSEKGLYSYDQYQFPAFNINPRLCLGKQFAMTEAKVFAYHFLKTFTFERMPEKTVTVKTGAILNMSSGLFIKVKPRE